MEPTNSYLKYLQDTPQEVVSSQNPGLNKRKQLANIDKDIQIISKNIMGKGVSGGDVGESLIKNSTLNDILDFEDYQQLLNNVKKYIKSNYPNNWYASDIKDSNLFTGLLKEASELIEMLFPVSTNVNIENLNIDKILDKLADMFFYVFILFIHQTDEMSIYSLINSYIKLSEDTNFNRDRGLIFHNAWDTIVLPVSIKQPHLILIKLLDFWFGLDSNWESLKTRINIKIMKENN